jgi:hypothetical protein
MIPLPQYLSPTGQQIVEYVSKAHFKIQQNGSYCSNKNLSGSAIVRTKTFLICTQNMLNQSLPNAYIEETVIHEAVHVAQYCRGRNTLGIPKNKMHLSAYKLQDVKSSISITRNPSVRNSEYEAYWLEDKPEQVIYYLKKFCF